MSSCINDIWQNAARVAFKCQGEREKRQDQISINTERWPKGKQVIFQNDEPKVRNQS